MNSELLDHVLCAMTISLFVGNLVASVDTAWCDTPLWSVSSMPSNDNLMPLLDGQFCSVFSQTEVRLEARSAMTSTSFLSGVKGSLVKVLSLASSMTALTTPTPTSTVTMYVTFRCVVIVVLLLGISSLGVQKYLRLS